jgi:2-iminobutanoate/2-iminopropanoate deaminase
MKNVIHSELAPKAIGPYSIGIIYNQFVFTSGQIGIDPESGELVVGGIEFETRRALQNLQQVLESGGSSIKNVLKTTVFLKDIAEFGRMNAIYSEFFKDVPPARSAIQVAALPKGAAIEIEAIAYIEC